MPPQTCGQSLYEEADMFQELYTQMGTFTLAYMIHAAETHPDTNQEPTFEKLAITFLGSHTTWQNRDILY